MGSSSLGCAADLVQCRVQLHAMQLFLKLEMQGSIAVIASSLPALTAKAPSVNGALGKLSPVDL